VDKAELKEMTVAQLRDLAKQLPDVKGLSSMKKDDLVALLAKSGGATQTAPAKASAAKPKKAANVSISAKSGVSRGKTLDKAELKKLIRELKQQKQEALAQQDRVLATYCNRQIHAFKHRLRRLKSDAARTGK